MKRVYLVVSNSEVGGMQKRLIGLFMHLARAGRPVHLVAARQLVEAVRRSPDGRLLDDLAASIVTFEGGGAWFDALRTTTRGLAEKDPGAVVHIGLVAPFRLWLPRTTRVLYTIPNSSLRQYNAVGLTDLAAGVLRADLVDVLDPHVFRQLRAAFVWRRKDFRLTPGSFVDLDLYRPLPAAQKQNRIVFSGVFSEEKQAPRLAREIPALLSLLERAGLPETEIWMLGRDVSGITAQIEALGVPRVRAFYCDAPHDALAESKVFLSLQRSTNHPSKALLEAMACGCVPVVTDTRDSRLSAPDELATYVPRDFSAHDLARACVPILRRSSADLDEGARKMRSFLSQRFTLEAMASYYWQLYAELLD